MEIKQRNCDSLAAISEPHKKKWREGKWYSCNRIVILKADQKYCAVSVNFFQWFGIALLKFFGFDYLKRKFGDKKVEVLSSDSLKQADQKTTQAFASATNQAPTPQSITPQATVQVPQLKTGLRPPAVCQVSS